MQKDRFSPLIDGHTHVLSVDDAKDFPILMDAINAVQVELACPLDETEGMQAATQIEKY